MLKLYNQDFPCPYQLNQLIASKAPGLTALSKTVADTCVPYPTYTFSTCYILLNGSVRCHTCQRRQRNQVHSFSGPKHNDQGWSNNGPQLQCQNVKHELIHYNEL